MPRDMTKAKFRKECERYGFVPQGFLGYYKLGDTDSHVSIENAGTRRRDQLAYLIREHQKAVERQGD